MVEIELSVMEGAPGNANYLLPLLEEFEKTYRIRVKLTGITWGKGWGEIVKFGIYGHGPDVSSIGTTWIGSLASMQALRPYSDQQVREVGGAEAFFDSIWQTGLLRGNPTLWAMPWLGDAMLLYYWEKALTKAGVNDFQAAFATDEAFVETLEKLQRSGMQYPLAINIQGNSIILHEAAHWIWSEGGDFISPDGRQVTFNQPLAIKGLRNYFKLRPFISPDLLTNAFTGSLFNTKQAAIHFAGPWLGTSIHQNPDWDGDVPGVAAIPRTTFAGGSSLVIWQYTLHPKESFELVRFLATQPVHNPTSLYDHQVPTRREAINAPLMNQHEFHRAYLQSMQRGRSFPSIRLWGAVEDKLRVGFGNIWADLFANPNQDIDACLHKHLDPLAERLNLTLGN